VSAAALAELIRSAGTVVALTGAGISVPSGIPDFRSPGTGLWENVNPMEVAHIDVFRRDPQRFQDRRFRVLFHEPNLTHLDTYCKRVYVVNHHIARSTCSFYPTDKRLIIS